MKNKILFVVTSHSDLGTTGKKTGYFLSEVTHPWSVLETEYDIDVVSPKGGRPPVTGFDLNDPINRKFWDNPDWQDKMSDTLTPEQVNPANYVAIFYAGGHGAMWDFPDNKELQKIASAIYENGGYVAAVCHGPAGIINIPLSNGKLLINGKKFDCFTNAEEEANGTAKIVPFMLQTALEDHGGIFNGAAMWADHVVVDGRLLTGQNPMSALSLGKVLLEQLKAANL
ncbi:MAG: type 1 glutamine amidotransferase domain-containing protein [Bacteroides sp.]|nr:type 1 glutamine amidotransferase domain-containing protein [Bacteroides sp.]